MIIEIFRSAVLVATVKPEDSSELVQIKQQQDTVNLNFTLDTFVEIKVGDYVFLEKTGYLYYINTAPRVIERPADYHYECIFEGSIHELRKTKAILETVSGTKTYKDYKFPLTGNAQTFLQFIVECLNREGAAYVAGTYKQTEYMTVNFNNWNIFEAITEISKQLEFDWWLDNFTLHFDAKPLGAGHTFRVGLHAGFLELIRFRVDNQKIETVVYGYGGTENMPPRTADTGPTYDSPLLTENRLAFIGVNGDSKLENNVSLYGRIESIQEFPDIKPQFTGSVDSVDGANNRIFYDASINFDINSYLLAGIKPKITFLSGTCIGLTFDISFVNATKQITVDIYSDESGTYPNDLAKPAAGDTYKLLDLILPAEYLTDAAARLQAATQEYLTKYSKAVQAYEGSLDSSYIQSQNIVLNLGDIIRVISIKFGIDNYYPINALVQKVTNAFEYNIQFGDILPKGILTKLQQTNFALEQEIYNINSSQVTNNQVTNIIGETTQWEQL